MLPLDRVEDSSVGPFTDRMVAASVFLAGLVFIWFLFQVQPDPRGHGTHEQWGMPKCGFVVHYGVPCPTCGVTTSGAYLVRLQVWSSLKTQPFGFTLGVFGLWLAGAGLYCLVRRKSYVDLLERLPHYRIVVWGVLLLLAAWLYTYLTFENP